MSPETCAGTSTRSGGRRLAATAVIAVAIVALAGLTGCASSTSASSAPRVSTTVPVVARVSVFGDSLSVQAGAMLRWQGRAHGLDVTVEAYFGLAPCDLVKAVQRDIAASPDALVFAFSGNNLTPCMKRNGKSVTGAAYYVAYRHDMDVLVTAALARKIPVLVVGAPAFPAAENVPDRVLLNAVLRAVAASHPGARYAPTAPDVTPHGFARTLPCLPEETAALGCVNGRITVRSGNGIHFDDPRRVPCPTGQNVCYYTAGGHRFANAVMDGLSELDGLNYVDAPPSIGVPAGSPIDR